MPKRTSTRRSRRAQVVEVKDEDPGNPVTFKKEAEEENVQGLVPYELERLQL